MNRQAKNHREALNLLREWFSQTEKLKRNYEDSVERLTKAEALSANAMQIANYVESANIAKSQLETHLIFNPLKYIT